LSNYRPQDLFSWSAPSTRSLLTTGTRYFSIDSGVTNIVGFNQNGSGDYGDWFSGTCPQSSPFVQNAFSCSGQSSDVSSTSAEGINLDVIGYDLVTVAQVNPPTAVTATATSGTSVTITWTAPSGTVPTRYHVYRSANNSTYTQVNAESTTGTSFSDTTASTNTAYLYKVRSVNVASAESSDSNKDLATTVVFTDPTITVLSTVVKAAHITQLRTAVNAVRTLAGLGAFAFTDSGLAALTPVRAAHINDLRTALNAALTTLTLSNVTFADSPLVSGAGGTPIKKVHITDLRGGVQ
jgi:hypothetical protein